MTSIFLGLVGSLIIVNSTVAFATHADACNVLEPRREMNPCSFGIYKAVVAENNKSANLFIRGQSAVDMDCAEPLRDQWSGANGLIGWTQLECTGNGYRLTIKGVAYRVAPDRALEMNGYLVNEQNGGNQLLATLLCK